MTTRDAFEEHIAAFNAHDTARLLAGFADDAVWITGEDAFRGSSALEGLFGAELWDRAPRLQVRSVLVDGDLVAAELRETLMLLGSRLEFTIAVFLRVRDGLIQQAKVYREGSADL